MSFLIMRHKWRAFVGIRWTEQRTNFKIWPNIFLAIGFRTSNFFPLLARIFMSVIIMVSNCPLPPPPPYLPPPSPLSHTLYADKSWRKTNYEYYIYIYIHIYINIYIHIYINIYIYIYILILCLCMTTLTEVFPCFFLSCKANARVKPAKTWHGPHGYPIAVKYIISFIFIYIYIYIYIYIHVI